jgi:non-canonical (house-cleaning) NTP pyrophosphatase
LYSRIGKLDLLEQLAPRLSIPETVVEEVRSGNPIGESQKSMTELHNSNLKAVFS